VSRLQIKADEYDYKAKDSENKIGLLQKELREAERERDDCSKSLNEVIYYLDQKATRRGN
jgi:hypothetical protein